MGMDVRIKKVFDGFVLDMDFQTEAARIAVLGESGSGKSMLLKCIAGLVIPDEGHIIVDGKTFFDSDKGICLRPQERQIGYLFQNYALFPNMTVEKNIGIGIRCKKEEKKRQVTRLIREYRLEGLEKRRPAGLSGGQQQRVALARMQACQPEIVLMDEPYTAMDAYLRESLQREMIKALGHYEGNLVFVSHSQEEVYCFGQVIALVHEGKILQTDSRDVIFQQPKSFQAAKLTGWENISTAQKKGPYQVFVPGWNLVLETEKPVPDRLHYVGIRAADVCRAAPGEENSFLAELETDKELPFERQFTAKPEGASEVLYWKDRKAFLKGDLEKKRYLCLPKNKLLFIDK